MESLGKAGVRDRCLNVLPAWDSTICWEKKRKKPASKDAGAKQYISVTLREVHGMFWGHKNDFCVHQGGDKDGF